MYIEIKNRFDGSIILSGEYESVRDCLVQNRGANLYGADLTGANLTGADLTGANLYGANTELPIILICGTAHNFYYIDGTIRIGCEFHSTEYWRVMYDVIGRENNYTEPQIREYKNYIDMCVRL